MHNVLIERTQMGRTGCILWVQAVGWMGGGHYVLFGHGCSAVRYILNVYNSETTSGVKSSCVDSQS